MMCSVTYASYILLVPLSWYVQYDSDSIGIASHSLPPRRARTRWSTDPAEILKSLAVFSSGLSSAIDSETLSGGL